MILIVVIAWIIAGVIFSTKSNDQANRWAGALAFFIGVFGLSVAIKMDIAPFIRNHIVSNLELNYRMNQASVFLMVLESVFIPYSFLMFTLYSAGFQLIRHKLWGRIITVVLVVPVVTALYVHAKMNFCYLDMKHFAWGVSSWIGPYFLLGNVLLLFIAFKAGHSKERRKRIINCFILIPATLLSLYSGYYLPAYVGINTMFFNFWITLYLLGSIIIFATVNEALGLKLRVTYNRLDSTMRAVNSGTSILNHAIKNEVAKISMCAENIRPSVEEEAKGKKNVQIILNSTSHLLSLAERIQAQVREIKLQEVPCNLEELFQEVLTSFEPLFTEKKVKVQTAIDEGLIILCDPVHLREAVSNVIKNALEAIGNGGIIKVSVYRQLKQIIIAIEDNGVGIPKENLSLVMEPFFSTKNRKSNYGLGLSYVYNVIFKHGGNLDIESKEHEGTTVYMSIPLKRVKGVKTLDGKN